MMPNPRIDCTTRCTTLRLTTSRCRHAAIDEEAIDKKKKKKKKKWLHGAHAAYAANEPQANERTQRMEGKDCQNKPPLQKGL